MIPERPLLLKLRMFQPALTRPDAIPLSVRRRGFLGLALSQFLGSFNDHAFKMLILS